FAKTVVMDRPEFGQGAYRYFGEPPEVVTSLRRAVYPYVARIANRWRELLDEPDRYPDGWDAFPRLDQPAGHQATLREAAGLGCEGLLTTPPGRSGLGRRAVRRADRVRLPRQIERLLLPGAHQPHRALDRGAVRVPGLAPVRLVKWLLQLLQQLDLSVKLLPRADRLHAVQPPHLLG